MRQLFVLAALIAIAVCQPTYKGYQYLGRGFDVAFADLRPLDVESFGNSFGKFNVFQADTNDDIQETPVAVYQTDFSTVSITNIQSMANNKSSGIHIDANYDSWGLSGQGSLDSGKWSNAVQNQSMEYYTSFTSVCSSQLTLIAGRQTPSFTYAANNLPTTYAGNEQTFLNFIKKFGTHFIIGTLLGGRQNFWTIINSTQRTALGGRSASGGITVNSRKLVNATLGGTTSQDRSDGDTLISQGATTHVYAYGGDISLVTNTRDFSGWTNSVLTSTFPIAPVTMTMQHYIDLVPVAAQDALRSALVDYHAGSLKELVTPTIRNTITAFYSVPTQSVDPNQCKLTNTRCAGDVNTATSSNSANGSVQGTETSSANAIAPIFVAFFVAILALFL